MDKFLNQSEYEALRLRTNDVPTDAEVCPSAVLLGGSCCIESQGTGLGLRANLRVTGNGVGEKAAILIAPRSGKPLTLLQ